MRIRSTSLTESHTNRVRRVMLCEHRQEVTDDVTSGIRYKLELKTFGKHFLTSSVSSFEVYCGRSCGEMHAYTTNKVK